MTADEEKVLADVIGEMRGLIQENYRLLAAAGFEERVTVRLVDLQARLAGLAGPPGADEAARTWDGRTAVGQSPTRGYTTRGGYGPGDHPFG